MDMLEKTLPSAWKSESHPMQPFTCQNLFKGKVASEGFAHGPVKIINRDRTFEQLLSRSYDNNYSVDDFKRAVDITELQLKDLQKRVEEKLSDVASLIFTAHHLLLKDNEYVGSMLQKMEDGASAPVAILSVTKQYMDIFTHGSNSYMREKVQDLEDLSIRLLGNLVAELHEISRCEDHIVIAQELFPSDMLKLSSEKALGVVLVTGGVTSHLSILARSLEIPLVIIDSHDLIFISDETMALLDAEAGNLYVNPSRVVISSFNARNDARRRVANYKVPVKEETLTKDGTRIRLLASINLLSDLKLAREVKCEGIGLYRSEFPFLIRSDFPTEEEQYVIYRKLVESMPEKEISFRTLDIGGDKVLPYYDTAGEQNPFLGLRSIRFSLSNRELFLQQLRAMLRAGVGAQIRISFPMISSLEEFLEGKAAIIDSIDFLEKRNIPHNNNPKIGLMIEVPSVLAILDDLAHEADFFSIGSNDLVQYILAVDRTNEKVAHIYNPHHPAVLRSIKQIVETAARYETGVIMCGDMAHHELYIPFLLGTGIRELSLESGYIPKVQEIINKIDMEKAREISKELLLLNKMAEIEKLLKNGN
jgi:phosphotransferase system enzyme I (PtsP)